MNICIFDNDTLIFHFILYKTYANYNVIKSVDLNDIFQYNITHRDILEDLGRCIFIQLVKQSFQNCIPSYPFARTA